MSTLKKSRCSGLKQAQRMMQEQKMAGMTWQKIADDWGLSKATAWRIGTKGHEPKENRIRRIIGEPEIILIKVYRNELGQFSDR